MNEKMTEQMGEKRRYTAVERLFAYLSLLAGYGFCRVFPASVNSFAAVLYMLALFAVTAVLLKLNGARFGQNGTAALVFAALALLSMVLYGNDFLHFLSYVFTIGAYVYFVYAAQGGCMEEGFSPLAAADVVKAALARPFSRIGRMFPALTPDRSKNGAKILLKLLLGVALAVIPTTVVFLLLESDSRFAAVIHRMFSFDSLCIGDHIVSFILGIPAAMYIFGVFISAREDSAKGMNAESCRAFSARIKAVPEISAVAAVIPLLFLYTVYFVSQWDYYVSAFSGVLPESFSYAEYAREGFFELCLVAFINFLVIVCIAAFMRRKARWGERIYKILSLVLCLYTLVLIATAVSKLCLYIEAYGLTQLRVYAAWFMALLTVLFLVIVAKQFVPRLRSVPLCLTVAVVMYLGLALSGVDGLIARYNVDRYENGTLYQVDVYELSRCGGVGVEQILRYADLRADEEGISPEVFDSVEGYLKACDSSIDTRELTFKYGDPTFWEFDLADSRAARLLREYHLTE